MASRILTGLALALSLAACDDDAGAAGPDPHDVVTIELRQIGDIPDAAMLGLTVPNITYHAVDSKGKARAGVPITWSVVGPASCTNSCFASVEPVQSATGANGQTSVNVTVGMQAGVYRLIPATTMSIVTRLDTVTLMALQQAVK